jgi:DNA helicase-2/ATP-dependent DNA helicase PcrA
MIPSSFQNAIFEAIKDDSFGNMIISAVAGSGKTTTIVKALSMIPSTKKVIMLAFNKKIAEELNNRVDLPNVQIKTFHAIGLQVCRNLCRNPHVDGNKLRNIIQHYAEYFGIDTFNVRGWNSLGKIISIGKNSGIGSIYPNEDQSWIDIINHHDIFRDEEPELEIIIPALIKCLNKNNSIHNIIDFDDMVYFPILFNLPFPKYDWVFADEVQDASEINRKSLKNLLKSDGRLCVVGDPHQAIYGFRGADSDSMNLLMEDFGCKELPLSVSYRCARRIVEEAQTVVSHIIPSDHAEIGAVSSVKEYSTDNFMSSKTSAVICRNTAPLVKMTYSFISRGIPAIMLGRDIGKGIITLIKTFKCKDVRGLAEKLDVWKNKMLDKSKDDEKLADQIMDKYECVSIFIKNTSETLTASLISEIERFFSDDAESGKITLSTIHKSKGLEWDKVFILDREKFYPKWATRAWMKEQEKNIHYVALTRPKNELIYIASDCWK